LTGPLFVHRRAAPVRLRDRLLLGGLILVGVHAAGYFLFWWFARDHVGQPILFAFLSAALVYGIARLLVGWYNVLGIEQPSHVAPEPGLRVAFFITATPGEPPPMFDETLAGVARVRYPHTTYLLDDSLSPEIAEIAARHGAVRLELLNVPGAKAGKINAALALTNEEFIVVLDPDHVPFPEMLDRVLGHFSDPRVGFVQVSQAYVNATASFVARAAAEQTYAFYGPTLQGMYGHGTSVVIGANGTFRRTALESIGGHGVGLAEDLITAIRLHGAGWRGVYIPEIVSRGLVPEELGSFVKQQLKWSRGVGEVFLVELKRAFRRLGWKQRLSYLMTGTYYFFGATMALYNMIPLLYLAFGWLPARVDLAEWLQHARAIEKEYLAVVYGRTPVQKGKVELGILRDPRDRKRMTSSRTEGRPSITLYERLAESSGDRSGLTAVRCLLLTGRTHQIRVHLKAIHLSIVGDPTYGSPRWKGIAHVTALRRRLVHCYGTYSNLVCVKLKAHTQAQQSEPLASGPGADSPPPPVSASRSLAALRLGDEARVK
jgi:hypothetical protein